MFAMDYAFLKNGDEQLKILVMVEYASRSIAAMQVEHKGIAEAWVAKRIAKWIGTFGYPRIRLRVDGEGPINALAQQVQTARPEKHIDLGGESPKRREPVEPAR